MSKRLTNGDRPFTPWTADVDVGVHATRNERIVRKLYLSIPELFLFRRRPEVEGIISNILLIQCHSRENP